MNKAIPPLAERNDISQAIRQNRATAAAGIVLAGAFALASCSPVPTLPPAPLVPGPMTVSPTALPAYHIQVGDVLEVRLLLNPELNEEVTVRPDGHISTTAVPDMLAYGRSPADLADSLRAVYARDLQNPRVSVVVKSFAPTRVYVAGEVTTPGEFITVGPTLTLSQAIARAGGTKLSSADSSVFVIRRGLGDKPEFLSVKWKAVRQGVDPNADIRLAPYRCGLRAEAGHRRGLSVLQSVHPAVRQPLFRVHVHRRSADDEVISTRRRPTYTDWYRSFGRRCAAISLPKPKAGWRELRGERGSRLTIGRGKETWVPQAQTYAGLDEADLVVLAGRRRCPGHRQRRCQTEADRDC